MKIIVIMIAFSLLVGAILVVGLLASGNPELASQITTGVQAAADNQGTAPDTAPSLLTMLGLLVAVLLLVGVFKFVALRVLDRLGVNMEEKP